MANKPNLGKDLTITFSVNGNVVLELGLYTDVAFKPMWTEKKVVPINNGGIPIARSIYGGHDVQITFARRDSVGEQLGNFVELNWVNGGSEPDVALTEIVKNDDGTYDTFQYVDGIIYPTDDGSYKAVDEVNQIFKMFFSRKLQVQTGAPSYKTSGT